MAEEGSSTSHEWKQTSDWIHVQTCTPQYKHTLLKSCFLESSHRYATSSVCVCVCLFIYTSGAEVGVRDKNMISSYLYTA